MNWKSIRLYLIITVLATALAACTAPETAAPPESPPAGQPAAAGSTANTAETAVTNRPSTQSNFTPPTAGNDTQSYSYPLVDTGQTTCYDNQGSAGSCPAENEALYGQDAQFTGSQPAYADNGDGTITDLVTGLMWAQSPDINDDGAINAADKVTYDQAVAGAGQLNLAGYTDWRLPTIKELYSLILFSGLDPSGYQGADTAGLVPFIDTTVFDFAYGDSGAGERIIDAQFASSTRYASTTNGQETLFGVNFADGRIKGYGLSIRGQEKTFYVLYVRGSATYGSNDFVDNGNGTISDLATGLTWQQTDSGQGLNWAEALSYCTNLTTAGYDDWRLPNAKELQSIVDYGRSPDTTGSAAIDPLFDATPITNEAGQPDYAAYWSSTTHANMVNGLNAAYVNFGRSMGYMNNNWIDVHGAGAQRSDPKSGDPAAYPTGHGPQGDAIRIENYARCVRDGASGEIVTGVVDESSPGSSPPALTGSQSLPDNNPPAGPNGRPPDLAAAAAQLGVTEAALRTALGDPAQGPPDLAAAARQLGVTEEALRAALGILP